MAIDFQLLLKLLRWILHIIELMPPDMDQQPIATTARELLDSLLPSHKEGECTDAET